VGVCLCVCGCGGECERVRGGRSCGGGRVCARVCV
jgi:hypothetical protein